ncbi:RHS repeat-associated core domain-containing protein [Streptomyces mutabilis]|uniref:RHS repeat-associated core domain-containing protein n=1 Tax=Streptomyces mutabilis TaxID=67332 RepID=UPI003F4E2DD1
MPQPYRYAGAYADPTGLYKMGHRYYDPTLGRFTQPDPSGQETNPYLYAAGDPINNLDPSGLGWLMGTVRFVKSKGGTLLSRAGGAVVVGCYAKKAWEDTDDSLSDEAKDLTNCANPLSDITGEL